MPSMQLCRHKLMRSIDLLVNSCPFDDHSVLSVLHVSNLLSSVISATSLASNSLDPTILDDPVLADKPEEGDEDDRQHFSGFSQSILGPSMVLIRLSICHDFFGTLHGPYKIVHVSRDLLARFHT